MKKLLLLVPFIMLLVSGCVTITVPGSTNTPPTAYIDSIQPAKVNAGQVISFIGHGADADGTIISYEWRSNLDGVLSTLASFNTSSLSVGTHGIYFRVLDNYNLWSADANSAVTVTPNVAKPLIQSFAASPGTVVRGGATELKWSVSGAQTVSIDNGIGQVPAVGSMVLYPSVNTVFTLTAVNQGGSVFATASVVVQESSAVGNPVITFTAQHLGGTSWQLNWNVLYATQIEIVPDIGIVGPAGSVTVSVPSGQTKTYRLNAINDWGWAYHQVILVSP